MSPFKISPKRKNILIIWFLFHGAALFLNFFRINGNLGYVSKIHVFLFSASENRNHASSDFWPFVGFYEKYYSYLGKHQVFKGIFYQYDFSEFIAYTVLIFAFLYFKKEK